MAQLVRKRGGEILVNTQTAGLQGWPAVAAFAGGGFVTVWNDGFGSDGSGWGVKAQLFDSSGAKAGGEFLINQLVDGNQLEPTVAVLADGNFAVTWMAPGNLLKARLFNASGQPLGDEFTVNATAVGEQSQPNLFALGDGGFAVAWWDHGSVFTNASHIRVQMFDSDGGRGPELVMGTTGSVNQAEGVGLASGNLVVVWLDQQQVNGSYPLTIRGQMFDPAGAPIGGEFFVSPNPGAATFPEIAALPNGGFVAVWDGFDTLHRARAQLFDASGAKVGGLITVGQNVYEPKVTALSWGGFMLAWMEASNSSYTLKGQLFDGGGNLLGSEFQINTAPGEAGGPNLELTTTAGDAVVAVWRNEEGGAGERIGVKMQILSTPNVVGTSGDDILAGGTGDDSIAGLAGADQMTGGLGNDVYSVNHAGDQVIEQSGEGTDGVETGLADYSLPDHVEDLTGIGPAGQILRGNGLDNILTGGAGDDSLHLGGAGNDTAKGGAGNDLLVVDWQESAAAFTVTSGLTLDFVNGQNRGYKGAFQAGSDRSVAFTGINRFHIMAGSAGDTLAGADGSDILDGGGGDDILVGGSGSDVLIGGAGVDTVDYSQAFWSDLVVNLGSGAVAPLGGVTVPGHSIWDGFGVFDSVTGVENVKTGPGWDFVYGDGADNRLETGDGFDFLRGGGGSDVLIGGLGNDLYSIVAADGETFDDTIVEIAGGGLDEVATDLASFSLAGIAWVEFLTGTSAAGQSLTGNALNNRISGAGGNDLLRLDSGGNDSAFGGGGNDVLYFGAAFTSADKADGGSGRDALILQGNYVLTLSATNLNGIESLSLQSGSRTTWGDTADNFYDYAITTHDSNVAAGQQLIVNGQSLRSGEDFAFDGSAESDGFFLVYGGHGDDTLKGGAGNDAFFFEGARFGPSDTVDGGSGRDALIISAGNGVTHIEFGATSLTSIESISLNARYATDPTARPSYELVLDNGNVAAGANLIVNGNSLGDRAQTVLVDGSAVHDGTLTLIGGFGNDTLIGGDGGDLIQGGEGIDVLTGGGGADVFRYASQYDSTSQLPDRILDFASGTDRIDLGRIDADVFAAGDQAFHWIGADAFTGSAGELRAYEYQGSWYVEGDMDGNGAADLVIQLVSPVAPPVQGDFLL